MPPKKINNTLKKSCLVMTKIHKGSIINAALTKKVACVQPPLPSKKSERSSFPIFLRGGAAVHRLQKSHL